ncbi:MULTISPECIES: glycosyltransferase [unclassified Flavobacterium]|uniref:glycosyltransferase n=1 Tax=unclassified Flavobacterium TaxID=196869 RepID=UPI00131AC6CE|nr:MULTISPECIES: glycosyltransferase [unclassified Flavobacterium]
MNNNNSAKTILIAPLNWGLGHATRCIPIIKALLENNFTPIIASDGVALALLKKEFPDLKTLELPSYEIEYAKKGKNFKWKLIQNSFKTVKAIRTEKKIIRGWIEQYQIDGILSDNRLGVFDKKVPSVYITHQLNVLTGNTTWITSKIHQYIFNKYKQCWVPDYPGTINLTGNLGHLEVLNSKIKYIGPISRLQKKLVPKKYDLLIILSGPEPQRGILENKLKKEILNYQGKVIFIEGNITPQQNKVIKGNVTYFNFMNSEELENVFNESEMVLCRSGYTTIMDLAVLRKKAFFIPTPGQYEQEYLAKKLMKEGLVPYVKQDDFIFSDLEMVHDYKGLPRSESRIEWTTIFEVFNP